MRLTRDSLNTVIVTQNVQNAITRSHGFRGLKPLWHIVSRLKWIPGFKMSKRSLFCLATPHFQGSEVHPGSSVEAHDILHNHLIC